MVPPRLHFFKRAILRERERDAPLTVLPARAMDVGGGEAVVTTAAAAVPAAAAAAAGGGGGGGGVRVEQEAERKESRVGGEFQAAVSSADPATAPAGPASRDSRLVWSPRYRPRSPLLSSPLLPLSPSLSLHPLTTFRICRITWFPPPPAQPLSSPLLSLSSHSTHSRTHGSHTPTLSSTHHRVIYPRILVVPFFGRGRSRQWTPQTSSQTCC